MEVTAFFSLGKSLTPFQIPGYTRFLYRKSVAVARLSFHEGAHLNTTGY